MRVYVCGKFTDKARVQRVQAILRDGGHTISHDWTQEEKLPNDPTTKLSVLAEYAVADMDGVGVSHLVVGVFVGDFEYRGTYGEIGGAIISGTPVIIIGHYADKFIFKYHPLVIATYDTIGEFRANAKLFRYAGEVRIKGVE